jgi:simple sugar transport system permease protein
VIPGRCRGGPWALVANAIVLLALFVGTHLVALAAGESTGAAWPAPWSGDIILTAAGLLFLGLGFLLPLHAGLLNVAIQGQFLAGFIAGSLVARYAPLIPAAGAGVALLAGAAAGALIGIFVAWLKRRFAVHEILSGLLVAGCMVPAALYFGVGPTTAPPITIGLAPWADPLAPLLRLPPSFVLTWGILLLSLGLVLGVLAAHFLRASVRGFELRAVGSNPLGAVAAGVDVDRTQSWMMGLGGACAGLTGALQLWSDPAVALTRWPIPLGYAGLAVAFLGGGYLRGALAAALVLGVWLNVPGATAALSSPMWGAATALLLALPALWVLPRLLPDQGAPRSIWRTRHREPI